MNSETSKKNFDIGLLYDLYFDKLYKFFYYKVLSKESAEDLTSETFMVFADILKQKKDSIEDPVKFLFGVAKNIFLQFLKKKYKTEIPISVMGDNFEDYVDKSVNDIQRFDSLEDRALQFINQLPEAQKVVLHMRLIDKAGLSEICERLGKNMNYVKTTQKRGLKRLKELIELNGLQFVHQP